MTQIPHVPEHVESDPWLGGRASTCGPPPPIANGSRSGGPTARASICRPALVVKGGIEPHGAEVLAHASAAGLEVRDVNAGRGPGEGVAALIGAASADVLNAKFFIPEELLRSLYHAADAVLANSGREPFGLVGLEVMSCGGIAITGATGEEYLRPFENGISVETADSMELATYLTLLADKPDLARRLRREGRATAERFTWDRVIGGLRLRLGYIARRQGMA